MRIILLAAMLLMVSCSANRTVNYTQHVAHEAGIPDQQTVLVNMPSSAVQFHGYPDFDKQNSSAAMMYPGGTPELFFVAVLTHAAIQGSVNESKVQAIQNEADKILVPYLDTISRVSSMNLVESAAAAINDKDSKIQLKTTRPDTGEVQWHLTLEPVYYFIPDQKSILIRNVIKLSSADAPDKILYQNLIEVLSESLKEESPVTHWNAEQGANLEAIAIELLEQSIDLAVRDIRQGFVEEDTVQKTYSFMQGSAKSYQRGNLLMSSCTRSVIRTLRGWIKSFPARNEQAECVIESPAADLPA